MRRRLRVFLDVFLDVFFLVFFLVDLRRRPPVTLPPFVVGQLHRRPLFLEHEHIPPLNCVIV